MNKIGIFDSGIGGISILLELIKIYPKEEYIYYADYINNPYGEKTKDELIEIGTNIINILLENKCNIIVIACNTMTIAALEELKMKYRQVPIIGITPNIEESSKTNYKNILLMGTPYTIKSNYVKLLISKYKKEDQNIIVLDSPKLAPLIETYNYEDIREYLEYILKDYKYVDCAILGCTHYSLIKSIISDVLNKPTIDNISNVIKTINEYIEPNSSGIIKDIVMLNSSNNKETFSDIVNKISKLNNG